MTYPACYSRGDRPAQSAPRIAPHRLRSVSHAQITQPQCPHTSTARGHSSRLLFVLSPYTTGRHGRQRNTPDATVATRVRNKYNGTAFSWRPLQSGPRRIFSTRAQLPDIWTRLKLPSRVRSTTSSTAIDDVRLVHSPLRPPELPKPFFSQPT